MKATILCPGPSLLHKYQDQHQYFTDFLICVNKARNFVPSHDWWVAGEANMIQDLQVDIKKTQTGVFSIHPIEILPRKNILWKSLGVDPTWYSSVAALRLARYIGCKEIHVYGHDMDGSTYYDGTDIGMEPIGRWHREGTLWDQEVHELRMLNINVTRH